MADVKEAVDLAKEWCRYKETGDPSAEKKLIEHFLYLVDQVVSRIAPSIPNTVTKDDLRSYGFLGLIDAVRKFDPDRGNQFVTYGTWRIRGAILDGLREIDWLPRSLRDKAKKVEEAYSVLEQNRMGSVSDEEVSAYLGISVQELHKILQDTAAATFLSLDEPLMDDENQETNRKSHLVDENSENPEKEVTRRQIKQLLTEMIRNLPKKEQLVLSLFYFEELSFTEIAEALNLSTSRISQLHTKAILRLRSALSRKRELL
jgi:RNA polymerase sigma factor for flagellar operon FliA